jgi:hypothetical protein
LFLRFAPQALILPLLFDDKAKGPDFFRLFSFGAVRFDTRVLKQGLDVLGIETVEQMQANNSRKISMDKKA